jgi:hypothetical protein
MNLSKIEADDVLLFSSLAMAAIGAALVTLTITDDFAAALGVALMVFGIPACLIVFMAAGEPSK